MKMILSDGRWLDLDPDAAVTTGKLIWVDAAKGSDNRGLPYRVDRPYQTLAAASAAAVSGDTVYVLPGDYSTTTSIAKAWVNWHFLVGAKVTVETVALFKADNLNGSTAYEINVFGDGVFTSTSAAVLSVEYPLATVRFRCSHILAGGTSPAVSVSSGTLYLDFPYNFVSVTGFSGSALINLTGGTLIATGRSLLQLAASTPCVKTSGVVSFSFRGLRMRAFGSAVEIGSTAGGIAINAEEVSSEDDHAIKTTGAPGAQLNVSLVGVKVSTTESGKQAIYIGGSANYRFQLTRCTLGVPADTSPICIDAAQTTQVDNYSSVVCLNSSNKSANITAVGGAFSPVALPI